ncbi:ABC transporter permease [Pontibacter korlensis]|uniref:ABC transporter permease n=1 Tax=Pontibacter korlensis TaxID=400092 RepID=A0A0E3UXD8_9BACT|nr:ABC transporter permease [Pontibacter korlensis]AKD04162.1 ABC transporter permease [Pontibacter korlensis]
MKQVWISIKQLWRDKFGFRLALAYLMLLLLLVIILPWLPLPYNPNHLDVQHAYLAPFTERAMAAGHPLGTDSLGRDLLANLLYGARTAFLVSFPVMLLTTLLGVTLGTVAGFLGDRGLVLPSHRLILYLVGVVALLYYGLYLPFQVYQLELSVTYAGISSGFLAGLLLLLWGLLEVIRRWFTFLQAPFRLPVDMIVMRTTEAITSIPRFVLILVLASFIPPSLPLLMLLLVLSDWPSSARLARAEMLRIKQLPYFEAAQSIGNKPFQLVWRHALPNLAGPVLVAFTFGLGGLLALESTLSFLNIGVPSTLVSWGRTISSIRSNTSAWWLVALPGSFLSLTVLALYTCSYHFTQIFTTRSR